MLQSDVNILPGNKGLQCLKKKVNSPGCLTTQCSFMLCQHAVVVLSLFGLKASYTGHDLIREINECILHKGADNAIEPTDESSVVCEQTHQEQQVELVWPN